MAAALCLLSIPAAAQPPPGPLDSPALSPREAAPIDLTGYWVSIVNEDWRWRMVTPPKGDYTSITMLNPRGREVADQWDPSQDGSCKAYGAANLLRMPTRLHIVWQSDDVLELTTDSGSQTRLLRFAPMASRTAAADEQISASQAATMPVPGTSSLQGESRAEWQLPMRPPGRPTPGAEPPPGGSLRVTTTALAGGWLRRNGVPYSERTTLTEFFDRFQAPNGSEWLVATTIVEDPEYLTGRFVTSSHFRREPDGSKWSPTTCRPE